MEEPEKDSTGEAPPPPRGPRDGAIDFSQYSQTQLQELQYSIDRHAYPRNFANLTVELERRAGLDAVPPSHAAEDVGQPGRFTDRDGLWGWLHAKRRRLAVYGSGSLEVRPDEVIVNGWQRTWLGVPEQATVVIPAERICNVARDEDWVRFEWARRYRLRGRVEFKAQSVDRAAQLMEALPSAQTAGFQRRWAELRDFNRRLTQVTPRVWVTPVLVLANVAIFLAMALATRHLQGFDLPQVLRWGANHGVDTVNGQLWRLLSALFLHGNLLHLLLNMWALWNVGKLTERLYGSWTFALIYFATGLLASVTSVAWDLNTVSVGASGAIFGILGAFLAFLMRRRAAVPAAIVRSHWLSTLAFVLFNLVGGFLQQGIDNAAHVGGLLSGLVLGWITARPLDAREREGLPVAQSLASSLVTAGTVVLVLWQLHGVGGQFTVPEQYFRSHQWYATGEADNLRRWQELAGSAAAGNVSDLQLAEQFEKDILPFWRQATERLHAEIPSLPAAQRPLATLLAQYAQQRFGWAQAVVDAGEKSDAARAREGEKLSVQTTLTQARIERIAVRASMDHRARTLSGSEPVAAIRSLFTANRWKCVEEPALFDVPLAATDSRQDGPAARQAAGCRAQRLFLSGRYTALEQFIAQSSAHLGDERDGGSTLSGIFGGLSELLDYGTLSVPDVLGRTSDWRRAMNGSVSADLVEAMMFESWAWAARGTGGAKEVSRQAWAAFGYRTEMAAAALQEMAERGASSPFWYQLSISVGLDQSLDLQQLQSIFDKGNSRFPNYGSLDRAMLRTLMPRWLGSYEKVDEFINTQSNRLGPRDKALYARLYWSYSSMERDEINIFDDALAAWGTMRAGFEEMRTRYPDSDVILNAFAKFACLAGDSEEYAALRPQLTKRMSATAWSKKVTLQTCDTKMRAAASKGH